MRPYSAEAVVKSVGRRIAELRRDRGLTQEQLATTLGVTAQWVSTVERGTNLTVYTLVKLANVFRVPPAKLFVTPRPDSRTIKPGRPKMAPARARRSLRK